MFPINDIYLDEGVSYAVVNTVQKKIEYHYNNSSTKVVTFTDDSKFDEAKDAVEGSFVELKKNKFYKPSTIQIIKISGSTLEFAFQGGKVIKGTYDNTDTVLGYFEDTFVQIGNKFYNGANLHVAKANETTLTIDYWFDGGEQFSVTYDDASAFNEAKDKLNDVGNGSGGGSGGGGGGSTRTATPEFSVKPGKVEAGVKVTITCKTEGATIHYTTDGTDATLESPTYTTGTEITVPEDGITIKAVAVVLGLATSRMAVGEYKTALYDEPYYKGWLVGDAATVSSITAADLKGLDGLEMAEAIGCNSPDPNIYTATEDVDHNSGRTVWAYPAKYGECHYFTDGLGKHALLDSFTKFEVTVGSLDYIAYVLTDPIAPDTGDEYPMVFTAE